MKGTYATVASALERGKRVIVAMSGGVDSAVAALMLKRAGFDAIGVTMKNFCYGEAEMNPASCCSLESIEDAKRICAGLDMVHQVVDVEELFASEVIDNFFAEYRNVRTPNPCFRCNITVRFHTLQKLARTYGAQHIATGHYARVFTSAEGVTRIARAAHREKDQSYYLSGLDRRMLGTVIFPLGDLDKARVRALAAEASLPVADKEESQEVCFIPDGDLKAFLSERIEPRHGPIVTASGDIVGTHEGLHTYTIGQRRKLGISAPHPQYVLGFDRQRNALIVGKEEELYSAACACSLLWFDESLAGVPGAALSAQIRSRHTAAPVEGVDRDGEQCVVRFERAQKAITPGQTIVFYGDDLVVGAGLIEETIKGETA